MAATLELKAYTKTEPGRKAHVGGKATGVATVRDAAEDNLVEKLGNLLQGIERLYKQIGSQLQWRSQAPAHLGTCPSNFCLCPSIRLS